VENALPAALVRMPFSGRLRPRTARRRPGAQPRDPRQVRKSTQTTATK